MPTISASPERPRLLQVAQMADVQQIEDAIGEDDCLAVASQAGDKSLSPAWPSKPFCVHGFRARFTRRGSL